jgi:(5-formylfuran-3-yl)methyl phosphate synthase
VTRLLVSVRSASEAATALAGGADIIDVKEPRRGALGPADPQVWQAVLDVVGARVPTSAALGDLEDDSIIQRAQRAAGLRFVKAGLGQWQSGSEKLWLQIYRTLPSGVSLIPAISADAQAAGWPSLDEELEVAFALASVAQSPLLLIDTFDKCAGTLLSVLSIAELRNIMRRAAGRNLQLALAGSLDAAAIEQLLTLNPAYIGVRGAACLGGRDGAIDLARVKTLAQIVARRGEKQAS